MSASIICTCGKFPLHDHGCPVKGSEWEKRDIEARVCAARAIRDASLPREGYGSWRRLADEQLSGYLEFAESLTEREAEVYLRGGRMALSKMVHPSDLREENYCAICGDLIFNTAPKENSPCWIHMAARDHKAYAGEAYAGCVCLPLIGGTHSTVLVDVEAFFDAERPGLEVKNVVAEFYPMPTGGAARCRECGLFVANRIAIDGFCPRCHEKITPATLDPSAIAVPWLACGSPDVADDYPPGHGWEPVVLPSWAWATFWVLLLLIVGAAAIYVSV